MAAVPPISPLRGLLEVTKLVRSVEEVQELLDAIARTISDALGFRTVVINLYRPAWDDFVVTTVYGNDAAREMLLGTRRMLAEWDDLISDRFNRRGAYVVLAGTYDWSADSESYIPELEPSDDDGAWHPEDALFLPMRHSSGHLLGILSVDEPVSGRRATDEELDVLVSFAEHAALAVQSAQERAEADSHQIALEQLLTVSSSLVSEASVDEILRLVCAGVHDALGFENVIASLREPSGRLSVRASRGFSETQIAAADSVMYDEIVGLIDPEFEVQGCYLLPSDAAQHRLRRATKRPLYLSQLNGSGPWAWNHHWLVVPLRAENGDVIGVLWADEPRDRLLPSPDKLQALRVFANQATAAVLSSQYVNELRFLADHDPLTRLLNRRAFIDRLDGEVGRARRYGRSFGLVLCDLDGFKELNDRHGHLAGDEALQRFGQTLIASLRKGDEAFRIGGDEFALMLAEASEDDAREVVDRINAQVEGLRASFGVASCPEHATDAQTLFRLADEALYEAKRNGSGLQFVA
ncbi:MAG TPA: diguanylate cyclase [Gaiellaceae bacterium]|jgi:diguanylate cyclase (GGDEF)-like protein